ncbi:MAG: hypothetical protein KC643_15500 [Nitrospira sp.]|nr:hypothetical protein [Nitrospira sp.]
MSKIFFLSGIVWLCFCLFLNLGYGSSVLAEELVFSSGFGVSATSNFPGYGSEVVTGHSNFSVPGFDPSWGNLQSVEVVVSSNYSFQVRNNFFQDGGALWKPGITQLFLTPTVATTDPFTAFTFSPQGANWYQVVELVTLAPLGGITSASGSLAPVFGVGGPRNDAFTLAEYTRAGPVPIITHLQIGNVQQCCSVLNGTAAGAFKVIYNFAAGPDYSLKPIILDQNSNELFSDHLISAPPIGWIGYPASLTGGPTVIRADGTLEVIQGNTVFYVGDRVETGSGELLEIKFNDDTNFSISQNTRLDIDEYVYDDGSTSVEPTFSLLRGVFIWTSDLVGIDRTIVKEESDPVACCGIRGDAADYVGVKMSVGSPVTLHTAVDLPSSPFTLSFDYAFLTDTGQLEVIVGDQSVSTVSGAPELTNKIKMASVLIDNPALLGKTGVKLAFTFDGPTGSQLLVDHISLPGLGNGNFTELDKGWFKKGPGTLEFVAMISEEQWEAIIAAATDEDEDGIPNDTDLCPASNLNPTVIIGENDSGVKNHVLATGCSISDLIAQCAASASEHGEFVSCVSHLVNDLSKQLDDIKKGAINSAAGQADIP